MTEEIGKVKLVLDRYCGEDRYSDGAIEDELLRIARDCSTVEYQKIIEEEKSWPVLYHLSSLRENIVEFLPLSGTEKVLEVGSGCGAITGKLSEKAREVTCVDLSKKRSMVNAYRHSDAENITIHVGNFTDVEPDLPDDYDVICLIGVLEYAIAYIGGKTPYQDFLNILKKHLKKDGRIVIAIENRYGLKYFAGATEDHLGTYFGGIENYREKGSAKTYSRNGLTRIFRQCGLEQMQFFYPYPDYKFMTTLFSDERLPLKGELANNIRNFDRDRMVLFDEKAAYDGILEEEAFPMFSNSYLVVLGKKIDVLYTRYSNDRAEQFCIKTELIRKADGELCIRKHPMTAAGREHIREMAVAYEKLKERFAGSDLKINRCELTDEETACYASFDFVPGKTLAELMDTCLEQGDTEGFYRYFDRYMELISYHSDAEVTDYDLVFSNILVDGETWTLIDYEWTFGRQTDPKELAFRAIYCYLLEDEKRGSLDLSALLERLQITEKEAEAYREREQDFQKYVDGGHVSMPIMRDLIGRRLLQPRSYLQREIREKDYKRVQVYEDCGNGYQEENSYFVEDAYTGEDTIELTLRVSGNVRMLRVDPAMGEGICRISRMVFNGEEINLLQPKFVIVNGRLLKQKKKDGSGSLLAIFEQEDPNVNFAVNKLERKGENEVKLWMEMVRLPKEMLEELSESVKGFFG